MKLRSTLLFAAASLTASALAPVEFAPVAYAAGESISVNFASESGAMGENWNDTTGASGTVNGLKDSTGETLEDLVLTYASKNVWSYTDGVSDNVLKGYLDDGDSGVTIGVSGISYLVYDVTILVATDTEGSKFSAKTINGKSFYGDGNGEGVAGSDVWGISREKTVNGNNSFTVSGLAGDLSISSVRNGNGRGCVAGIIVTNAYDGVATNITLNGTAIDWTDSSLGNDAWTNSTADAGTYVAFDLTADTAVNVAGENITTDAITVDGSGVATFSGNAITLTGPSIIRTDSSTASIVFDNQLIFSDGGFIDDNVSWGENASINVLSGVLTSNTELVPVVVAADAQVVFTKAQTGAVDFSGVSGEGTVGIVFASDWASGWENRGVSLGETKFTGTVYVAEGYFSLNAMEVTKTLRVGSGTMVSLVGGTSITFSKNLVLDASTEFHQNGGANLTFDENSTITGSGTYVRRGGGTLTINGNVELAGFTLGSNSGVTNFAGTVNIGEYNQTSGTSSVSGAFSVEGTLAVRGSGKMTIGEDATLAANWVSTNTGGTITQSGGTVTAGGVRLHDLGAGAGNSTYNLSGGLLNVTGTTKGNSTSAGVLIGHWGNGKGVLNVSGGVLNAADTWAVVSWTSPGEFNISGGEVNVGGICLDGQLSTWSTDHSAIVALSGGRLNVGADGLRIRANGSSYSGTAKVFKFNGGTLGALDSWGTSDGITLGGDITIDTQSRVVNSTGVSADGGIGTTISLGGVISGSGNITKSGIGTLALSGANTFTGNVTVNAGTVVAGNSAALGTGTVSLAAGTTLKNGMDSDSVTVGTLTTVSGSILNLGTNASTTTAAFASTNTATLAEGTIFDAQNYIEGMQLISGLSSDYDVSWLTENSLRVSGAKINSRGEVSFAVKDGVLVLEKYTAGAVYNLTWAGTDSANVWTSGGDATPWTKADDSGASNFETGDSVTFGDNATSKTVLISGAIYPAAITFSNTEGNDYAFAKATDAESAALVGNANIVKNGSGKVTIEDSVSLAGFKGNLTINEGVLLLESAENLTFSNTLSGAGTFEKSGTGTMILTGDNGAFTGTLAVSGGTLKLGSITALGAGYSGSHSDLVDVVVKKGGTLDLNGMTRDGFYGNYTLSGGALINTGAEIGSGSRQLAGGITLTEDSEVGGTSNFGIISSGYGATTLDLAGHTLTKTGTNVFYLTNTTITAGTIDIQGGEVSQVNYAATASEVDFIIGTAGALRMSAMDLAVKSITSSGDGALYMGGKTLTLGGDSVLTRILTAGTVNVSDGVVLTLEGARFNAATFSTGANSTIKVRSSVGELTNTISGSGALVKETDGTYTLAGTNTYTGGTTVSAGTLKAMKNEALGAASTGVTLSEGATLELAFGGTFSRTLNGTGTVAKSGADDLEFTSAFGGSFSVKEGLLAVNVANGSYKNLSIGSGATFKAVQNLAFESVSNSTGTLSGETENTRVSVSSGAFAGTLSNVALVKTGTGTLDFSGAKFAKGGSVVVENGTASNLKLADSGTLYLSATESSDITLSNLTISNGTIRIGQLWDTEVQATITGSFVVESGATLTLFIEQLTLGSNQAVFTFTSDTKSAWETAFGTLTADGKFTGGTGTLTLAGLGTYESGVFSWDGDTLYFKENREAKDFVWTKTDDYGKWSDENWNDPKETFQSGMNAVFNENSVSTEFAQQGYEKGAYAIVDEDVFAAEITINAGSDACVSISEEGGKLSAAKGISVESGALYFYAVNSDFYTGEFKVAKAGTVILGQPTLSGVDPLNLRASFSGTGTIQYGIENSKITLSGDRSQFTGTLDVNAGTVVLANGTGTEAFTSIDIAGGATVAANGGTAVDGFSTLSLNQVSGTGTLSVSAQGAKFFALDLSGSSFTGTVELDAVDMVLATNPSETTVTSVSNLAKASSVRLTNNASLNFFNTASTFDKDIEVADTNGAIRVYGNNTGATLSGDISGVGTLTVKDGGKLILSGAVGTAESALGGLTLSAGSLEISGENSSINISGNVSLTGSSATINTTGTIGGNLVSGAWGVLNPLTLGGDLSVGGNLTFVGTGQQGRVTTVLENAKISVAGTTSFEDNEAITIGENSTFDSSTITTSQWGVAATLDAGATLSAGTLTFGKDTDSVSGAAEGDASRIEIGTEDGTGTLSGTVVVKDITFGVREGATQWSSSANVKFNGGTTTFDVGSGQEITLNGTITEAVETATGTEGEEDYIAATSSALVKDGAGTLTLGKANANKGGVTINAGTLKFTATDGVTLSGAYTFAGGMLAAGANTTLSLGSGATLSGAIVYTNDSKGKLLVAEDVSVAGEGNSLTLHEKAEVEIASGKTLSLGLLNFTGNGSEISGEGTLSLAGTVTVDNNRTNTIGSGLALSEDSVLAVSKGTLKITSEDISTNGKTLTKTGAGTLTLDTDAVYDFDGSFSLQGGTVNIGSRELTIADTHRFELASKATLEGDLVLGKGSSAILGAGTVKGDVTLSGATLSFTGSAKIDGALSWTDSNTITLDAEFRKTITSTPYTLVSFTSKEGDNANLTFTDVEVYGRRSFTLDISDTKIDLLATGTLVWNANVATWTTNQEEEADWTLEQTSGNTTSAFLANDYVEFRDSGSIVIADDTIQTSGVVFNLGNGGTFRLNAPAPATDENGQPTEEQKIVTLTDAVYGEENTTGKSAGLTVVSGNVTIGNHIVNNLSSVTVSSGSLTVFNVGALGIVDKTDPENEKIATLTIGGGVNEDGTPKSAELKIELPADDAETKDVNESVGIVEQKVAIVNAGIINVSHANTTVEIADAVSGAGAKLTKTGWGALKITRDSVLDTIAVDSGYLELTGNADAALSIKSVEIGNRGEMALVGDADGANTSFDSLAVSGTLKVSDGNAETPGLGAYRTAKLTGSGTISGNLYVGADTGFDITTNNADGSQTTTNYKGTEVTVNNGKLTLSGSIESYGTEAAALYKKGAGTLTLVSSEKDENGNVPAFTLGASVIHEAGTLEFTHGGVISKNYTIAENGAAKLSFNGGNASELSAGLTLGAGSRTTIENNGEGSLKISGISSSGATVTTLAGNNITLSGDTVDFGSLTTINDNAVLSALYVNAKNVTVDATTFTAGYVAFGNEASLAVSSGTTATANALYVGENVSATLDLTGGAKFSVDTEEEISVFGGSGTLNVKGGTLELKGATYGDEDAPAIVLDDATLAFNVTESEETVAAYLSGIGTAEGATGTIEKTGAGTLVVMEGLLELAFGNTVLDLSYDGEISVAEGDVMLFATAAQADVEIADGAAVEFAGVAELADSIDGVNTLAKSLSGAGTLNVSGALYVNANSAFDGTIKASGGTLYVSGATSDWMANGTNRVLAIEDGTPLVGNEKASGKVATYDESATLTTVSLDGRGIFLGAAEDKTLTVREVSATAGSNLTLQGYGTLGAMKFAEVDPDNANAVVVASGADWTIDAASENLKSLSVSGTATIANTGALGEASVSASGNIIFDAEGTYANTFNLSGGAVIEAKENTNLTGTLWGGTGEMIPAVTFVAHENAKLTLSDSIVAWTTPTFETKDATATIALNVTSFVKTLSEGSKLSGAGTFEKLGDKTLSITANTGAIGAVAVTAGTLEFDANGKLAVAEGGAGTLSVAKDATLKIAGTKLGEWTLKGEGSAEISGSNSALAAIKDASKVSLTGTLDLSGDISGSAIAFGSADAKLTTAGTAEQSIAKTTLSGETVTLINANKAGVTVGSDSTFDGSVKTLVLTADPGIKGGAVDAAFAGSLTKTLDGEWTVSDYTFGKTADQKLTVSGGTLVWKGAKLEANAGAIELGDSATLKINTLASGDTLKAAIAGAGTLEIAATGTETAPLNLETTAADNSAWKLHVSGGSYVKTDDMLPGDLWVEGEKSVFELALATDETVSGGKRYQVSKSATLKLSGDGTLTLEDTDNPKVPHSVSGIIDVAEGTFAQSGNIQWDPSATVNIGEKGTVEIDVASAVNNNNASFTGTGTLEIAKTGATAYRFGGKIAGFEGSVSIAENAKAELTGELFDNAKSVEVAGELSVAVSGTEQKNRELKNISGDGTLVVATPDDFYTRYGIYTYDTDSNDFEGTVSVKSGVLSLDVAKLDDLKAKVEVGGAKNAHYYEGPWAGDFWNGITGGGFLQLKNGNDYDAAELFAANSGFNFLDNAGTIYSGGTFKAASDFGSGANSLFVVDADTTLSLSGGADIDGSLLVKHDGELVVDYTALASGAGTRAASGTDGNSGISGDLTLNGDLRIVVTDNAINNGALFGVGGKVALSTDGGNATKIELEVTGTEDLDGKRVVVLGGEYDGNVDLNQIVQVTDTNGNNYKVARDANGQIVILNSATEYNEIPSGLSELATVIRDAKSPLWDYVQADLAQSTERLVGLSPVSYGSLVEMQSGFVALENDLLRERLEQRRYERAFVSDRQTKFKPFVNLLGSEREGDGNGTESANYDISHTGVLGGFDVAVSRNTIFGVSLGFDFAKADVHNGGGKHEGDSTRLGVYGMSVFDNAYFGYGISAGATSFETKRNSGYNGESLTGTTDGNDINASLLFGAGWTIDENLGIDLAPYVGLDFGYASTQAFTEEGGKQSALDIDKMERLSLRGKLGATLSWRAGENLRISLDTAFSHEFLDSDIDIDAAFAAGDLKGKSFSSTAYLMDENTIQIGPRVDYRIDDTWSVSGGYSYETDLDDTATHSANVGFRARF